MHHLSIEDLARLVDEGANEIEAAHLELCGHCRSQLDGLIAQTASLRQLVDPGAPVELRDRVLEAVAAAEGGTVASPTYRRTPGLRAAAGIALFLLGSAFGAVVFGPVQQSGEVAVAEPETIERAESELEAAEAEYLRALAAYAQFGTADGLDPLSRLAALEGIVLTTRAALREAPADPVINNYHLTAVAHRDALLRQIEWVSEEAEWF